jgi:diguanylate cyclase (GGDEF)-like protein
MTLEREDEPRAVRDGTGSPPTSGTLSADQMLSDADQTASDADQTTSDRDEALAEADRASSDRDQGASDRDQATSDAEWAAIPESTPDQAEAHEGARAERQASTFSRITSTAERAAHSERRQARAAERDATSALRDAAGEVRDGRVLRIVSALERTDPELARAFDELNEQAAADRARAARDRAQAARDRADAARLRARLEAEVRRAHIDDLTGVYRRDMGRMALLHEIERARRAGGRFTLAFADVDGLKVVNDRDGHAAGDRILQSVASEIRAHVRSFDPVIRYGGDEFVAGMGATDVVEAKGRFDAIRASLQAQAGVTISVGFATLQESDGPDQLIERADEALLQAKGQRFN